MDAEVADPDEEDRGVDGKDPEHKVEERVGVVEEVVVGAGMLGGQNDY